MCRGFITAQSFIVSLLILICFALIMLYHCNHGKDDKTAMNISSITNV